MEPTPSMHDLGIDQWSEEDRWNLIEEIQASLTRKPEFELLDWHKEILDQRIAEADANPHFFIPWEEVRARLLDRS